MHKHTNCKLLPELEQTLATEISMFSTCVCADFDFEINFTMEPSITNIFEMFIHQPPNVKNNLDTRSIFQKQKNISLENILLHLCTNLWLKIQMEVNLDLINSTSENLAHNSPANDPVVCSKVQNKLRRVPYNAFMDLFLI